MWWIFPWLLFMGCLGGVALGYLLWRQREQAADDGVLPPDVQDYR